MEVYRKKDEIKNALHSERQKGKIIGFVPTMGALHDGHIALVQKSKSECDLTVVSIFVNPTQFNDPEDYKRYPRTEKEDLEKLSAINVDYVFIPTEQEMYPEKDMRIFSFGHLEKIMEGKFRPGHFNGVAQIVSKLFEIVNPHKAYFGLKDRQQYHIVKALVERYMPNYNIQIIGVETVREPDGLAMSSRNKLLNDKQRQNATILYKCLITAKELKKQIPIEDLKNKIKEMINNTEEMKLEYFEITDKQTLLPIDSWEETDEYIAFIAAYCGKIRLIDNMEI